MKHWLRLFAIFAVVAPLVMTGQYLWRSYSFHTSLPGRYERIAAGMSRIDVAAVMGRKCDTERYDWQAWDATEDGRYLGVSVRYGPKDGLVYGKSLFHFRTDVDVETLKEQQFEYEHNDSRRER